MIKTLQLLILVLFWSCAGAIAGGCAVYMTIAISGVYKGGECMPMLYLLMIPGGVAGFLIAIIISSIRIFAQPNQ
ncbi:MAG: hypothetical protein NT023_24875 [Armatimonadetes bacterium]|nr:hypothetical protein [Armatimonadota bacterium]